ARILGSNDVSDIVIDGGMVASIAPAGPATASASATASATAGPAAAAETIDLQGRLVTPPLIEPHLHLDAVLTVGQPRPNVSGSLFEGIAVWADRVKDLTREDVQSRVRQILRWQLACGVQHVRSHVDVCDPELRALRALVDLREEARGLIDL